MNQRFGAAGLVASLVLIVVLITTLSENNDKQATPSTTTTATTTTATTSPVVTTTETSDPPSTTTTATTGPATTTTSTTTTSTTTTTTSTTTITNPGCPNITSGVRSVTDDSGYTVSPLNGWARLTGHGVSQNLLYSVQIGTVVFEQPENIGSGQFEIEVASIGVSGGSTNVPIDIQHDNGLTTVYMNQYSVAWGYQPFGTYTFTHGNGTVTIRSTAADPSHTVADAVRFTRDCSTTTTTTTTTTAD